MINSISEEIRNRYTYILEKYYHEDGYQTGRAIFRGRFKRDYMIEYGTEPKETDEQIDYIMSYIGTIRDGRIFPCQDDEQTTLIRKIVEDIRLAFQEGATAIYIEAIYERFEHQLSTDLQIYNIEALAELLKNNLEGFQFKRNTYITESKRSGDSKADILRVMKEFYEPQNYLQIHEKAWYIPFNKMKQLLVNIKSIVNISEETYFYAPNLVVSSEELGRLIVNMKHRIEEKDYITDIEMRTIINNECPNLNVATREYTSYGLRNCIGYLLSNYFSFNGSIISRVGSTLSMSDIYSKFAISHKKLYMEDLKEFSKSVNCKIYWESVMKELVRTSENEFIRKDLVFFDCNSIDAILEEFCPEKYIPLKDISLFLHFPNINITWNTYVLESYLYNFSKKFKLVHSSFSQDRVYGAMVRVDSGIDDYQTLIIDVLSKYNELSSVKDAIHYIVECGFQQRKRFTGIEQLIQEAKLLNGTK